MDVVYLVVPDVKAVGIDCSILKDSVGKEVVSSFFVVIWGVTAIIVRYIIVVQRGVVDKIIDFKVYVLAVVGCGKLIMVYELSLQNALNCSIIVFSSFVSFLDVIIVDNDASLAAWFPTGDVANGVF